MFHDVFSYELCSAADADTLPPLFRVYVGCLRPAFVRTVKNFRQSLFSPWTGVSEAQSVDNESQLQGSCGRIRQWCSSKMKQTREKIGLEDVKEFV